MQLQPSRPGHLYLFEHGKGRNIVTFWKTYWRTCRPRRFWTDLNPAQRVRMVRLMIYWLIACGLLGAGLTRGTGVFPMLLFTHRCNLSIE